MSSFWKWAAVAVALGVAVFFARETLTAIAAIVLGIVAFFGGW